MNEASVEIHDQVNPRENWNILGCFKGFKQEIRSFFTKMYRNVNQDIVKNVLFLVNFEQMSQNLFLEDSIRIVSLLRLYHIPIVFFSEKIRFSSIKSP